MAVTMSDIARDTGSSISSVSAALKGNRSTAKVSEKKRKLILDVAKRLGYRPSHAARTLKMGKTHVLGMVIGEIHTPYYGEMTSLLMEEAEKYGYSIQTYVTNWTPQRNGNAVDLLLGGRCDGILYFVGDKFYDRSRQYDYMINNNIPVVIMTNPVKGLPMAGEGWNSGFVETAEYLISRGIKRTAFLGDKVDIVSRPKLKAMIKIFAKHAIDLELIECHNKPDAVYDFGSNFTVVADSPEVILTENDTLATALIKGFSDAGVSVPDDVGVIGYNNTKFSEYSIPALTTIGFDKKAYVKKVIEMVMEMIEQKKLIFDQVFFPTYLVKRDSV
jgi:DNA-binding LacI/PurR family transcriptional regulator